MTERAQQYFGARWQQFVAAGTAREVKAADPWHRGAVAMDWFRHGRSAPRMRSSLSTASLLDPAA